MKIKKIKTNQATAWVIGIAFSIFIALDVYMWTNGIAGDTISEVSMRSIMRHPEIPFIMGVVMGHIFWPQLVTLDDNDCE